MRALAFAVTLLLAGAASAQDTGGSFGGGDWGGGADYGGGGGSDYGGGSDWGSGSSDWGSSDSGSSDWGSSDSDWSWDSDDDSSGGGELSPLGRWFVLAVVTVFAVGLLWAWFQERRARRHSRWERSVPRTATRAWSGVDVTCLRLALDWRARPFIQSHLDALARSGKTGSQAGLVELLHTTVRLLKETRLAWMYADVVNHTPMSQSQARGIFENLAIDARSRFQKEVVRDHGGVRTESDPGPQTARAHEGPGVVVVTIVLAARRELIDVRDETDAHAIANLLAGLQATTARDFIALEVVWSPAAADDRMSTAELEAKYPDMSRLDDVTVGGRVFCAYCQGPFADELPACPHCGAPHPRAPGAQSSASA